ncbi:putative hydrolase [Lachnospiraceae bacterium RM5]|nr:putative hydrolase [Lachnospiraceae bacterium RM5]
MSTLLEKNNFINRMDFHTHTIASGHAKDTIEVMIDSAIDKGLVYYGITDHAKTMPGTEGEEYFRNLKNIKDKYKIYAKEKNLKLYFGVELNIIGYDGKVDMDNNLLSEMDIVIASIHPDIGYLAGSKKENTNAYIKAMENPYVDIIGHPDDGRLEVDYEEFVKNAKRTNTLIEVNNSSLNPNGFRVNTVQNSMTILKLCEKYGVSIVIGSDAHRREDIAGCERSLDVIMKTNFPDELVFNKNFNLITKRNIK